MADPNITPEMRKKAIAELAEALNRNAGLGSALVEVTKPATQFYTPQNVTQWLDSEVTQLLMDNGLFSPDEIRVAKDLIIISFLAGGVDSVLAYVDRDPDTTGLDFTKWQRDRWVDLEPKLVLDSKADLERVSWQGSGDRINLAVTQTLFYYDGLTREFPLGIFKSDQMEALIYAADASGWINDEMRASLVAEAKSAGTGKAVRDPSTGEYFNPMDTLLLWGQALPDLMDQALLTNMNSLPDAFEHVNTNLKTVTNPEGTIEISGYGPPRDAVASYQKSEGRKALDQVNKEALTDQGFASEDALLANMRRNGLPDRAELIDGYPTNLEQLQDPSLEKKAEGYDNVFAAFVADYGSDYTALSESEKNDPDAVQNLVDTYTAKWSGVERQAQSEADAMYAGALKKIEDVEKTALAKEQKDANVADVEKAIGALANITPEDIEAVLRKFNIPFTSTSSVIGDAGELMTSIPRGGEVLGTGPTSWAQRILSDITRAGVPAWAENYPSTYAVQQLLKDNPGLDVPTLESIVLDIIGVDPEGPAITPEQMEMMRWAEQSRRNILGLRDTATGGASLIGGPEWLNNLQGLYDPVPQGVDPSLTSEVAPGYRWPDRVDILRTGQLPSTPRGDILQQSRAQQPPASQYTAGPGVDRPYIPLPEGQLLEDPSRRFFGSGRPGLSPSQSGSLPAGRLFDPNQPGILPSQSRAFKPQDPDQPGFFPAYGAGTQPWVGPSQPDPQQQPPISQYPGVDPGGVVRESVDLDTAPRREPVEPDLPRIRFAPLSEKDPEMWAQLQALASGEFSPREADFLRMARDAAGEDNFLLQGLFGRHAELAREYMEANKAARDAYEQQVRGSYSQPKSADTPGHRGPLMNPWEIKAMLSSNPTAGMESFPNFLRRRLPQEVGTIELMRPFEKPEPIRPSRRGFSVTI